MSEPLAIQCERLGAADDGLRHGFFTRKGGLSRGIYQGLNAGRGSRDDQDTVAANRANILSALGLPDAFLATPHQIHSPDALVVDGPWEDGERPRADAVVTATPGLVMAVLTADCGPVLLADRQAGVVAAAHAGWRGALAGILESTITAMEQLGARRYNIAATLGPTISQPNYEVGPDFIGELSSLTQDHDRWLKPSNRKGHAKFDLPGFVVNQLERAGVAASWTGQCTYGDEGHFYSYRRATHRAEPDYGRQLSAIALLP